MIKVPTLPDTVHPRDVVLIRDAVIAHTKRLREQVAEAVATRGTASYLADILEWYEDLEHRLLVNAPL